VSRAFQQRQAELVLEFAHRLGHGRLGDMQGNRRARETLVFHHAHEHAQQVQIQLHE